MPPAEPSSATTPPRTSTSTTGRRRRAPAATSSSSRSTTAPRTPRTSTSDKSEGAARAAPSSTSGGPHADVDVVVVVAALVRLPDALDPLAVVREGEQAAAPCLGERLALRHAGEDERGLHDPVADRAVVGAAVRRHADVSGVAAEVVGDLAADGELRVVGPRRDRDRLVEERGHPLDEVHRDRLDGLALQVCAGRQDDAAVGLDDGLVDPERVPRVLADDPVDLQVLPRLELLDGLDGGRAVRLRLEVDTLCDRLEPELHELADEGALHPRHGVVRVTGSHDRNGPRTPPFVLQ